MKKAISLLLALVLSLSLCAHGMGESSDTTVCAPAGQDESKYQALNLNEKAELGFVSLEFSSAALTYSVGGSGFSSIAGDGKRLFSLVGIAENTGNTPLPIENVCAEMVFNGQYTYSARGKMIDRMSYPASLDPLVKNGYWIYAEIPEALIEQIETCVVRFSLNKDCASFPRAVDQGEYCYQVDLDEKVCASALNATGSPSISFDECPVLPTPENFEPMCKTSSGSSSFNGKVSSIYYSYSIIFGRNDDLKECFNDYLNRLQAIGFTVKSNGGSSDIYAGATKLATAAIQNGSVRFDIVPGNEGLDASSLGLAYDEGTESAPALKLGDKIELDYCCLTLDDAGSDKEIRTGSSQYGSYCYRESENGDPFYYIHGTFKNTSGKPLDIRHIAVQFCFDDKYNYRGEVDGVSSGYSDFITDVAPLATVEYYIYTSIPQELLDGFKTCQIQMGFTENFDHLVSDGNNLPLFQYCNDVVTVQLCEED